MNVVITKSVQNQKVQTEIYKTGPEQTRIFKKSDVVQLNEVMHVSSTTGSHAEIRFSYLLDHN